LSALEQEDDSAAALLVDLETMSGTSADDLARVQNGRLHFAMRLGTLRHGLSGADAVAGIASHAKDPVVRASFWHIYAAALRAAAQYGRALEASDNALREISRFDLDFGRAHVYLTRAGALAGMAAYEEALTLLDDVARLASRNGDTYLQMNERTTRCKLLLLTGDVADAVRVTDVTWSQIGSRGQYAEFLASRALALAMLARSRDGAIALLEQAERGSAENEATALCTCIRALFSLDHKHETAALVPRFRTAIGKGVLDPFVFALRLDRRLPRLLAQLPPVRSALHEVLHLVNDSAPESARPRSPGYDAAQAPTLTGRQREVLTLLAEGRTNKEIATELFLTESTVKVHVRHVLQKLGVRTRTEAAIQVLKTPQHEVAEASEPLDLGPGLHST
jgi:ATP/maltotriose-dependent transcriptional regulator MalT